MSNDNLGNNGGQIVNRPKPNEDYRAKNGIFPEAVNPDKNQGMSVGSQVRPISVKSVDSAKVSLTSRTPNVDSRGDQAKESLFKSADNGGPRKSVNQFPLGSKTKGNLPARNFVGNLADSDQGN